MNSDIPKIIEPFLWSYDTDKLDLEKDKKRIITNVLNYGTKDATDWLFSKFKKKEICEVLKKPIPGEWNKKSLNFWSLVLGVKPGNLFRQIS